METVAIVGVGLIGASFGLALRAAGFTGRILGVSSANAIAAGLKTGAISEAASLDQAADSADLIYLSQPVDRILETLEALGPIVRPGCLVTDAGSTKLAIVSKAAQVLPQRAFLGGHPMAGKEQRGAEVADGSLFRGRPYILTPVGDMTGPMVELREWLVRLGAETLSMSAAEHDYVIALTSHLPQLLSTAISLTLARQGKPELLQAFGPGLLDMTRLSMSSAGLWQSILDTNRGEILRALAQFSNSLGELRELLETGGSVDQLFSAARGFAAALRNTDHPE